MSNYTDELVDFDTALDRYDPVLGFEVHLDRYDLSLAKRRETDNDIVHAAARDCDLSGARLDRAVFDNCDLRGSDLSAMDPRSTRLNGAVIDPRQAMELAGALGLRIRDH